MIRWVTADTHFSHKNIMKFEPSTRPWNSVDEMDAEVIHIWNSRVAPGDIVYHLGDFSMCGFEKTMRTSQLLNGQIVLVRGNHDQIFRKEQNIKKAMASGKFVEITDYKELRLDKITVVMSHYAMRVWNKSHHGSYQLFGHSHGNLRGVGRQVDVGIDSKELSSNGGPFLLDDVLAFLRPRVPQMVDHHNKDTR